MRITVCLLPEALAYLRTKIPTKHGLGAYMSGLLLAERARDELRQVRGPKAVETKATWRQSGVNVD